MRQWLDGTPADPSVFGAVQPIYTAAPVLAPGMVDPLPARLLNLPGNPDTAAVSVPSPETLTPPPRVLTPKTAMHPMQADRYVRAVLEAAAGRILTASKRHPTLIAEARSLARFVNAGLLTATDMQTVLTRAAEQAGKNDAAEVAACIQWGLDNPAPGVIRVVRP